MKNPSPLKANRPPSLLNWKIAADEVISDLEGVQKAIATLAEPFWVIQIGGQAGVVTHPRSDGKGRAYPVLGYVPSMPPSILGDPTFLQTYQTAYPLMVGAMAGGISSVEMITSLAAAGMLGSFGSGGLTIPKIETAIQDIRRKAPEKLVVFNLLHNHYEPQVEEETIALYLQHQVRAIEASAFMDISLPLVWYRASGLSRGEDGEPNIGHRVIAKISRKEIAKRFLSPAPNGLLDRLLEQKRITMQQAELAARVPMADDLTVEADSGGHTDNRPLVNALPAILDLRDELQRQYDYTQVVRVGAGGGIATPLAALAAFQIGAAYIVTGSINQACRESGTSPVVRNLLARMDMADVSMAPAADMFEMGVRAQVLKRGSLFAARSQKLYELYTRYPSLQDLPQSEKQSLEQQIFRRSLDEVWEDTVAYFSKRDPRQLAKAEQDAHHKMALVFRWYLGMSSRWAVQGEPGREMDYQIWTGPAMGAFNYWVRGTYLADPANRSVADINQHILFGAAYMARVRCLEWQGLQPDASLKKHIPTTPISLDQS